MEQKEAGFLLEVCWLPLLYNEVMVQHGEALGVSQTQGRKLWYDGQVGGEQLMADAQHGFRELTGSEWDQI